MFIRLELTRMLLTMNASIALADKFHKNTGAGVTQVKKNVMYLASTCLICMCIERQPDWDSRHVVINMFVVLFF